MYSDPVESYTDGLVPAFESYVEASVKNQADFSLKGPAKLAWDMLYNFREEFGIRFSEKDMKPKEVGRHIADYDVLSRIVNVNKHSSKAKNDPLINDKSQIRECLVVTAFLDSKGVPYMYFQMRMLAYLNSGEIRDVLELCTNVMNGWSSFMVSNKYLPLNEVRFYRYTGNDVLTKQQADAFPDPQKTMTPGKKFDLTMTGRSFNYKTGLFEYVPIQLPPV